MSTEGNNVRDYDFYADKSSPAKNELSFTQPQVFAKINGFEIAVDKMRVSLSDETREVFELDDRTLNLEEITHFFEPPYRPLFTDAIENTINTATPFDLELLLRTAINKVIWVRVKGLPVIDKFGNCTRVKGWLYEIDAIKRKALTLQASVNLLTEQNKRLQNFAYIVAHNLRSNTGNLHFMINLFENEPADKQAEVFAHIKSISNGLINTVEHLNEIVKIHTELESERKTVQFEAVFKNVFLALKSNIGNVDAKFDYDFSKCAEISYIPAYLESILQNLLTNAIKYRQPDRRLLVSCHTLEENNHIYLIFEDNGIGIDLKRHGDNVFGMYKTFHENADAKGIGLFITRNQVESLGGSIKVDSTVNVGTKFTLRLV